MVSNAERQSAFISSWLAHGNVRRAMRECGVGSPTTAYRWIAAYREAGEATWQVVRSRPARRVSPEIADQIIAMRQQHPTWGKERIAHRLAERYGQPMVSPTGVRSVLREAGLWTPPELPLVATGASVARPDPEVLLASTQRGVQLDLFNRPLDAITSLKASVWRPLLQQPEAIPPLLQEPELGTWLVRGALQLSHALIDVGRWASALRYLRMIDHWLSQDASRPAPRQRAYQDAGDRWTTASGEQWHIAAPDVRLTPGAVPVSLRQDDIWLETQQYLGLVLRDATSSEEAVEALTGALQALAGRTPRCIAPQHRRHYQGVIRHDLAALKLRRGYPLWSVLEDLREAEALLAECGNHGMLAAAAITRATVLARSRTEANGPNTVGDIEHAVWEAFGYASVAQELVTRVRVDIEGTDLLLGFRDPCDDDHVRLGAAAGACVNHGFAVQARKLLERPRLRPLVPDHEQALLELVQFR